MREAICEIIKALPHWVLLLAMPVVVPLVILRGMRAYALEGGWDGVGPIPLGLCPWPWLP